jgi:hypothetical protein
VPRLSSANSEADPAWRKKRFGGKKKKARSSTGLLFSMAVSTHAFGHLSPQGRSEK